MSVVRWLDMKPEDIVLVAEYCGGGWPGVGVGRLQTFPSTRAFIAPGSSEATGSTLNGSGSH